MSAESVSEWQRKCELSLQRAHAKRYSPHPFPRSSDWRTFLAMVGVFMVLFTAYVLLWAAQ